MQNSKETHEQSHTVSLEGRQKRNLGLGGITGRYTSFLLFVGLLFPAVCHVSADASTDLEELAYYVRLIRYAATGNAQQIDDSDASAVAEALNQASGFFYEIVPDVQEYESCSIDRTAPIWKFEAITISATPSIGSIEGEMGKITWIIRPNTELSYTHYTTEPWYAWLGSADGQTRSEAMSNIMNPVTWAKGDPEPQSMYGQQYGVYCILLHFCDPGSVEYEYWLSCSGDAPKGYWTAPSSQTIQPAMGSVGGAPPRATVASYLLDHVPTEAGIGTRIEYDFTSVKSYSYQDATPAEPAACAPGDEVTGRYNCLGDGTFFDGICYARIMVPELPADCPSCTISCALPASSSSSSCSSCGSPVYSIDEDTLTVRVKDTPIWINTHNGPELAVRMSYTGNPNEIGDFGRGWTWNYAMRIDSYGDIRIVTGPSGKGGWWFIPNGDGTYDGPPSAGYALISDGGGWIMTTQDEDQYAFASDGQLSSVTNRFGQSLVLTYDANNQVQSVTSGDGATLTFTRDIMGRVTQIQAPDGRSATFSYGSIPLDEGMGPDENFLVGVVDMGGVECAYEYDWDQDVLSEATNTGSIRKIRRNIVRDEGGEIIEARDTIFVGTELNADGLKELTVTDPVGEETTYLLDATGTETIFTKVLPSGAITTEQYALKSGRHVLLARIDALGNEWGYEYNDAGFLTKETDPQSNETTYTRNGYGRVLTETRPGGATTTYTYDTNGLDVLSETDPLGNVTNYTYDTNRNLLSVSRLIDAQTSETTTYTYDSNGRRLTETLPTGRVTTNTYDTDGRLTSTTVSGAGTTTYTYNTRGLVATIAKPEGLVTAKTYDDLDRVTVETYQAPDPADNTTQTTTYGCCGIQQTVDRKGTITNYDYNDNGRRTAAIDHFGNETQFEYDAVGNQTVVRDALDNETVTTYDLLKRPLTVTYPDDTSESHVYDELGRETRRTDRKGLVQITEYDVRGNVLARKVEVAGDPDPVVYTLETGTYNLGDQIVSATNADGLTVTYTYDAIGRKTSATYPDTTSTTGVYDTNGLVQSATDRLGNSTSYTYDSYGRTLTITTALNNVTTYAYNSIGKRASVTDALNRTRSYTYDYEGRRTVTTYPDSTTEARTYSPAGLLTSVTDRTGISRSFTYDPMGRQLTSGVAGNTVSAVTYDELGHVVTRTDAEGITVSMTYDSMGREIRRTMPDATYSETTYGSAGVLTQTDRGGAVTTYTYNAFGQRASETNPNSETIAYEYDLSGRMTALVDANSNRTEWTYDTEGRLVTKTYADNSTYQYTYDAGGRMLTRTDAKDQTTSYSYDALGRLTDVDYPTDTDIAYTYDALGRKLTMTDASGSTSYTYDPQTGYPAAVDGPFDNDIITYSWDAAGRRTGTSLGVTSVATYAYDTMGRMSTVTGDGTLPTGTAVQFTYTYNGAGNAITGVTAPGGVTTTRTYDDLGRLNSVSTFGPAPQNATLNAFSYTYDDHDRRTQVDLPGSGRWEYSYDTAGQVTGGSRYGLKQPDSTETSLAQYGYEYDAMGNPTQRSEDAGVSDYTYNNLNQLVTGDWSGQLSVFGSTETQELDSVSVSTGTQYQSATVLQTGEFTAKGFDVPVGDTLFTVTRTAADQSTVQTSTAVTRPAAQTGFSHDLNGNMLGDGKWIYIWNEENRLVSATPTLPDPQTHKLSFTYDGQGRRRVKREYAWAGNAWELSRTTNYIWDGWLLLSERTTDNGQRTTDKSYICGLDLSGRLGGEGTDAMSTAVGIGGILAVSSSGATLLFLYDGNGNVTDLVDPVTTEVVAHYEYSPFGKTIIASGPLAQVNAIRFSSKTQDTTGLYYYGYRFYSPQLGRWVNRDPIGEDGGENVLAFVRNSPIQWHDSLGKIPSHWPHGKKCCNGQAYESATHGCCGGKAVYSFSTQCCVDNTVVEKVEIWHCKRKIIKGIGSYLGFMHHYVCCNGANLNCFGNPNNNLKKGDPIPHEGSPTGTCSKHKVCPGCKGNMCNNPKAPRDFSTVFYNCQDWAKNTKTNCADY